MMQTHDYQPPIQDRVREHSRYDINRRIDRQARGSLAELATPEAIRARLVELDREWPLDRVLMAVFSALGAITAKNAMSSMRRRGRLGFWGLLLFTQLGFLGHHAARGWCPPVAVLRRLGVRTSAEISAERVALERKLVRLGA